MYVNLRALGDPLTESGFRRWALAYDAWSNRMWYNAPTPKKRIRARRLRKTASLRRALAAAGLSPADNGLEACPARRSLLTYRGWILLD